MTDVTKPTTDTRAPNLSTEHQEEGDARRPTEHLDKDRQSTESVPRKSSLLGG